MMGTFDDIHEKIGTLMMLPFIVNAPLPLLYQGLSGCEDYG